MRNYGWCKEKNIAFKLYQIKSNVEIEIILNHEESENESEARYNEVPALQYVVIQLCGKCKKPSWRC